MRILRLIATVLAGLSTALLLAALGPAAALAAGCTDSWAKPESGLWSEATKWSTGSVPAAGDEVCIEAEGNYTVNLTGSMSAKTLTLGATSGASKQTLLVGGPLSSGTLSLTGDSVIDQSGVLDMESVLGTSATVRAATAATISNGGEVLASANVVDYLEANLTNEAAGSVDVQSGELRQDDNTTTRNEGTFETGEAAVFAATASKDLFVNRGSLVNVGSVSLTGDASWTQEAGAASESGNPVAIFNSGALSDVSGGGSFQMVDTSSVSGTVPAGQTVSADALAGHNAAIEISGTVVNEGTLALESPTGGGTAELNAASGSSEIENDGVVTAQSASGAVDHLKVALTNGLAGTVEVKSGELRQDDNTTTTNEGSFQVATGATFAATSSTDEFVNKAKAPGGVFDKGSIDLTSDASWRQNGSESGGPVTIFNSGTLTDESGVGSFDLVDTSSVSGTVPAGQTVSADALAGHNAQIAVSGTVLNEGTLALESPAGGGTPEFAAASGSSKIESEGVLSARSSSSAIDGLNVALTNGSAGTVEVNSGELRQGADTTTTNEGSFQVAAGATFAVTASKGLVVNKGSLANSGTVSLTNDAAWSQEAGGAVQSGNPVSIYNSGLLTDGSGGGSFDLLDTAGLAGTIPKGQMVKAEAAPGHDADVQLSGAEVVNDGTFVLDEPSSTSAEVVGNGALFLDKGIIEAQAANSADVNYLEADLTVVAGGSVDVQSGELRQDANTTTTNEGTFQVESNAVFAASASKDLFVNKGSLANSGTVSLTNDAAWSQEAGAAAQSGDPVTIFNSGVLSDVSGGGSFQMVDTSSVSGTVPAGQTVSSVALPKHDAEVEISGTVVNEGTLALESPTGGGTAELNAASGSSKIENDGVVTAQSASGAVDHLKVALTNGLAGTVEVKSGELRQDDNTTTTNEGSFQVATGATFAATSSTDEFVNKAKAPGGVFDKGSIDLTSDASWRQNGSESGGPVTIFNSGTLTDESGVGSFDLVDTSSVSGTVPVGQTVSADALAGHNAQIAVSGTVLNEGTLALESPTGGGTPEFDAASGSSRIDNAGVLTAQSSSSGTDDLNVALTNQAAGTVEVKSGELRQGDNTTTTNEGSFQVDGGATFAATASKDLVVNKGSLANSGTVSLTSDASWSQEAGAAVQSGSPVSVYNSGKLTDVSGAGSFDLLDTAGLAGTIPKGQTVKAEAAPGHNADVQLSGAEVLNDGTFVLDEPSSGSAAVVGNGASFLNKGMIDAQAASSSDVNYLEANLTNEAGGAVEVETGELRQDDNTTTTNEGTLQIAAGAVFAATSSKDLLVNDAGATLKPDIAGPTSFGTVKISGGATFDLGGIILPNLVGGYAPAVGTEFDVITGSAPITGEFATVANNFLGDYSKASSSPSVIAVKRNRDSTATALIANPETATHGQAVTLTATITTGPGPVADPTGTVTFFEGETELGTGEVSTSVGVTSAEFTTSALTVGHHMIVATYGGDANTANSSSEPAEVTVDPAQPTVTGIEPASGPAGGDSPVTIKGTGFLAGATVTIGGASASEVEVLGEGEITARTPTGTAGPQAVVVTDAGGSSNGSTTYTYIAQPTVARIEPSSGPTGGETPVNVKGTGFHAGATVTIGTEASSVKVISESEITALTSADSAGPQEVVVADSGGSSSKGPTYTYIAPPPGPKGGQETGNTIAKSGVLGGTSGPELPAPTLAANGNLAPVSGTVSVRLPGSSSFVSLSTIQQVPFGTVIEATNGSVSVTTTEPNGTTQTGTFFGGEFTLTQGKDGVVVATLTGGNFSVCPTARERSHLARVSSKHAAPSHVVRKLWANAHGSFSTKGNYAAGAVLGTEWLTEDLCDGTLIRVTRDKVAVTNLVNHHHLTVRTGHQYLAKAP